MGQLIETVEHKGYEIRVYQDEDPSNPRTEFDNMGRMICFHKRYELGDKHDLPHEKDAAGFKEWIEKQSKKRAIIALPIYMMDHSGITIRTSEADFRTCDPQRWDWGLLGWIYITNEKIKEEYSQKRISTKAKMKAFEVLKGEVGAYDDYLTGNVYGYEIVKKDADEDETYGRDVLDSCWGFFGDYNGYMVGEAKEIIEAWVADNERVKAMKEECPGCSRLLGLDEMDKNDETHSLDCPNCGAQVIENYRGE